MKYSSINKPLVCMQTQSTCYKGTRKFSPVGILWHCTGANNPNLRRYVQPSDIKPIEDTYSKEEWLDILGVNRSKNDWNHINREAGLNCWIGKLADGTVATIQTMPWDYRPWGCGSGSRGSCNNGWIQFEICEDSLKDENYFNAAYEEACQITAYLCKLFDIDPQGTVQHNGVTVPTILCHQDAYKLKLGSNHSDVYNWFNRYNKSMQDVRNYVSNIITDNPLDFPPYLTTDITQKEQNKIVEISGIIGGISNITTKIELLYKWNSTTLDIDNDTYSILETNNSDSNSFLFRINKYIESPEASSIVIRLRQCNPITIIDGKEYGGVDYISDVYIQNLAKSFGCINIFTKPNFEKHTPYISDNGTFYNYIPLVYDKTTEKWYELYDTFFKEHI